MPPRRSTAASGPLSDRAIGACRHSGIEARVAADKMISGNSRGLSGLTRCPDADLTRDARHFGGERARLVDHLVDRLRGAQDSPCALVLAYPRSDSWPTASPVP